MSEWKCAICGKPAKPGNILCGAKDCYYKYSSKQTYPLRDHSRKRRGDDGEWIKPKPVSIIDIEIIEIEMRHKWEEE